MKLRNKKTGEIADVEIQVNCMLVTHQDGRIEQYYFDSIKDLLEWEDYEEPKAGYIIDPMEEDCICDAKFGVDLECIERAKELGIWFETEEETEKTVEKLKAWTRLINHGLCLKLNKFQDLIEYKFKTGCISSDYDAEEALKDIDLLFGGEE